MAGLVAELVVVTVVKVEEDVAAVETVVADVAEVDLAEVVSVHGPAKPARKEHNLKDKTKRKRCHVSFVSLPLNSKSTYTVFFLCPALPVSSRLVCVCARSWTTVTTSAHTACRACNKLPHAARRRAQRDDKDDLDRGDTRGELIWKKDSALFLTFY